MITKFIETCKYKHYLFTDAYIEVLKASEHEDHFSLEVFWKCQRTNRILMDKSQPIAVLKNKLREWDSWPPSK